MPKLFWTALILPLSWSIQAPSEPLDVTMTSLLSHSQQLDGHLIRVQAVLVLGWEGDDFLFDPAKPARYNGHGSSVWFYTRKGCEQKVFKSVGQRRIVYGAFEGYVHLVAKWQMSGAFDPGPLQFEAVGSYIPNPQRPSLAAATAMGNVEETRRLLRSNVDITNNDHNILLFMAAETGRNDFAQELLDRGADPKIATSAGETSLLVAAWYCSLDVAATLLSHGAAVNAADLQGDTALMMASQTCKDGKMVELLLNSGASPNSKTRNGVTPLIAAAGNPLNVKELLKAGADPRMKTDSGETVESESCDRGEAGHYQVCQLVRQDLQKRGADSSDR